MPRAHRLNDRTSLVSLTWPIFVETLLQMLINNADQMMIATISDNAVAAVGNVNQIMNMITIAFGVISTATTILVSQYIGAGQQRRLPELYTCALFFNITVGAALTVLLISLRGPFFQMLHLSQELIPDATAYLNLVSLSLCFQAAFGTFSSIFRSNGYVKSTMYISTITNLLNIAGNALLIFGWFGIPKLGAAGVALSTLNSRIVGVIIAAVVFHRQINGRISFRELRPFPFATLRRILKIGLPSGGESLSYSLEQTYLFSLANLFGAYVSATRVYCNIITWLCSIYSIAVSQATQLLVGQYIGAGKEEDADKRVMKTLGPSLVISVGISVVIFFCSDFIISLFTQDPRIAELTKKVLLADIFMEVGRTCNIVLIRALQGAGDVRFPVLVGICCMWGIAVPIAYVLGVVCNMGLVGVWIGMACDECVRGVLFLIRWKRGKWRGRALVHTGQAQETNANPVSGS